MTSATVSGRTILPPRAPSLPRGRRPSLSLHLVVTRVLVVSALTAVAFAYSLRSLVDDWRFSGPLADLTLVPVLFVVMAVVAVRRHSYVETVVLSRLDWLVAGVALSAVAGALVVAPLTLGNYFWALRPDMLVLPLTVVAGVALMLGTRSVLALLFPLTFLLLAWPLPFTVVLDATSQALTGATGGAVRLFLPLVPGAHALASDGDLRVHVASPHGGFVVSVASACSGIEGLTGIAVIAAASMYVVRGTLLRRAAWTLTALVAAWAANVVRVIALLGAGAMFGRGVAMDALHPVAGLVLLNGVFLVMLLSLRRFGLTLRPLRTQVTSDVPLTQPIVGAVAPTSARLWRRLAAFAVCAGMLSLADASLASSAGTFDNAGRPAAVPFSAREDAGPGVTVVRLERNDWARPYFGAGSVWLRYRLGLPHAAGGFTVWLDSITTTDVGALQAHPVAACYRFHRFSLQVHRRVVLADGVVAERFVYTRPDGAQWHTLAWQWPVVGAGGRVRHERVVLFASSLRDPAIASPAVARPSGPHLRDALLAFLDRSGPNIDPNPAVTAALVAEADVLIADHVSVNRPVPGRSVRS